MKRNATSKVNHSALITQIKLCPQVSFGFRMDTLNLDLQRNASLFAQLMLRYFLSLVGNCTQATDSPLSFSSETSLP